MKAGLMFIKSMNRSFSKKNETTNVLQLLNGTKLLSLPIQIIFINDRLTLLMKIGNSKLFVKHINSLSHIGCGRLKNCF